MENDTMLIYKGYRHIEGGGGWTGRGRVRLFGYPPTISEISAEKFPVRYPFRYRLTIPLLSVTVSVTMNKPKCRLCDKRHYGLCPAIGESEVQKVCEEEPAGIGGVTKPRSGADDPEEPGKSRHRPGRSAEQQTPPLTPAQKQAQEITPLTAERLDEILDNLPPESEAGIPMTPAQKQQAYRKRHGDRIREMDRLRKRRKRDG